jgi:ApaG protein
MGESQAITRGIQVSVTSSFVPERSDPMAHRWFFTYKIRITNTSREGVQLVRRRWIITDANGSSEEVRGEGVVGEKPVLRPGTTFEYTSSCPLGTSFGLMEGSYQMVSFSGIRFDVAIAPFELSPPMAVN